MSSASDDDTNDVLPMMIVGGGIVGLTLALCLHEHTGLKMPVYDKSPSYELDVGAGMGMYANGLRVIRDISDQLVQDIREAGCPLEWRRFGTHDGTEVLAASEKVLHKTTSTDKKKKGMFQDGIAEEEEKDDISMLQSIGIRRWRLLNVLYDEVKRREIPVHFCKRSTRLETQEDRGYATIHFDDHTVAKARVVFAADGSKSFLRSQVARKKYQLTYTGVSCLMGLAEHCPILDTAIPEMVAGSPTGTAETSGESVATNDDASVSTIRSEMTTNTAGGRSTATGGAATSGTTGASKGISCPTSTASKNCHASYFPVSHTDHHDHPEDVEEQCFQINYAMPANEEGASDPGHWGTLDESVGREECHEWAQLLRQDGWDERYLYPLENVARAVRIGYCQLEPDLKRWVYKKESLGAGPANNKVLERSDTQGTTGSGDTGCRIVLLGDAAHPPVPYTGQGAQMGLEDAGTLALLLKHFFCKNNEKNGGANALTNIFLEKDSSNSCLSFAFLKQFDKAMKIFESLRIPRCKYIQECSLAVGKMQKMRSECPKRDKALTRKMQRDVFFHETLPQLLPGAQYDYKLELEKVLATSSSSSSSKQPQQQQQQQTVQPPLTTTAAPVLSAA